MVAITFLPMQAALSPSQQASSTPIPNLVLSQITVAPPQPCLCSLAARRWTLPLRLRARPWISAGLPVHTEQDVILGRLNLLPPTRFAGICAAICPPTGQPSPP